MGSFDALKLIPLTFIPIFVAIDPFGLIPVVESILHGMHREMRKKVTDQAVITAFFTALGFVALGEGLFRVLGISVSDFKIAGGLLLLVIAILDMVRTEEGRISRSPSSVAGVVPIGIPLIVGPALLTTLIVLLEHYGVFLTLFSLMLNLLVLLVAFRAIEEIKRIIGENILMALSKLMSILLAAIAVHMIRIGVAGG